MSLLILQKIKKRYTETHENSVMLVNPQIKWNIIKSSNKLKDVQDHMKQLLTENDKYNNIFLTLITITFNEKLESINLSVNFHSYKDGKPNLGKQFGKTITFNPETLIELGDITHKTIEEIVIKMLSKGKKCFDGIKPMDYTAVMNL